MRLDTPSRGALRSAADAPDCLHHYFERSALLHPERMALEAGGNGWTYRALDRAANGMAWALRQAGLGPGQRAGLALPRGELLYLAMLAIQKTGASYVPMDSLLPAARRRWLAEDAGLDLLIGEDVEGWSGPCWGVEQAAATLAPGLDSPPAVADNPEQECYVLYTSGSTGMPKGVPITQRNICAFLEAALPVYTVNASDRVYQGVSLSFDFALEEIWPAWAAGAALIASDRTPQPVGEELDELLRRERITVLCAVPTVLATLSRTWPELRQVVVSGEACPAELVNRWAQPGIRMLNAYGPTEITVSATIGQLRKDEPVTLGRALPHLRLSVRDAEHRELPDGEIGELCIAGAGVAKGYLNRPDQTAQRFVRDPDGPGLMYRSGDLASRLPDGRYLYFGRADDQIKLRGQRIEPGEIESVLLSDPAVAHAAVIAWTPVGNGTELAAYVSLRPGHEDTPTWRETLASRLGECLPAALRPSLLEVLSEWPELSNGKTDRHRLPPPTGARLRPVVPACGDGPLDALGERVRAVWSRILKVDAVPGGAHFFDDLGGHSLRAAQIVSAIRAELGVSHLAVSDLYRYPVLADFAAYCRPQAGVSTAGAPEAEAKAPPRSGWLCGTAQLGLVFIWMMFLILPIWGLVCSRGSLTPLAVFVIGGVLMPFWILIDGILLPFIVCKVLGPLKPGRYPVWGAVYLKFWMKRKLLQMAPARLLAGHKWWTAYLRALGARIGEDGLIATHLVLVPELLEIGPRVHIDANAGLIPFHIERGWLTLAPVKLGADACIGCGAVVQAGAVVPDGAVLAPQSALFAGDEAKSGWRHVGNPARPVEKAEAPGPGCRPSATGFALLGLMLLPSVACWPMSLFWINRSPLGVATLWLAPLVAIVFLVTSSLLVMIVVRLALRRTLPEAIRLDSRDYRRKWMADRAIALHQVLAYPLYDTLFTPPWLRLLGMRVGRHSEISTVSHFDPSRLSLGEECFVADLAAAGVAHHAGGEMRLAPTVVGRRSFVGNGAVLPAGSRLQDGVLLGVHSSPSTQRVTRDCLGVPAFDLPSREEVQAPEHLTFKPAPWRVIGRLACETLRVLGPPTLFIMAFMLWFEAALGWKGGWLVGLLFLTAVFVVLEIALVVFCMAAKWLVVGRYRPRIAPLWTHFVWRSQWITGWYEAIAVPALIGWLTGTPWWPIFMRGFGCRIGRNVFSDTSFITEFDLVRMDDNSEAGEVAVLQTHLFEDRVMKCGVVHLEAGASVGPRSVVLYGGAVGRRSLLASLSLVMKGERLPDGGNFRGVPASPATAHPAFGDKTKPETGVPGNHPGNGCLHRPAYGWPRDNAVALAGIGGAHTQASVDGRPPISTESPLSVLLFFAVLVFRVLLYHLVGPPGQRWRRPWEIQPRRGPIGNALEQLPEKRRTVLVEAFLCRLPDGTREAARRYLRERLARSGGTGSIVRRARGKPFLKDGSLEFSFAHRGSWCAVAISRDCPVGIDVEILQNGLDLDQIAAQFLPAPAREEMRATNRNRLTLFLRWWTRIEAAVKAHGAGLDHARECLTDVRVDSLESIPGVVVSTAALTPAPMKVHWRVLEETVARRLVESPPSASFSSFPLGLAKGLTLTRQFLLCQGCAE